MFLIPPDSRLSATCNWSQPSIGVENKSAINLHCERLSLHTPHPPTSEHFWSVTPHRWCRQTQKNCACCKKNKGGTAKRPTQTGACTCCCLFRDELESGWWVCCTMKDNYKDNPLPLIRKCRACTCDALPPERTSQSPESARPLLKWALRQLALALLSLMARMIQGCRTSDMCERDVFLIFTGM